MIDRWGPAAAGVLRLPSGRLVRGRALRRPIPAGPVPTFGVYLLGTRPTEVPREVRWLRWPDFWLPGEPALRAYRNRWSPVASQTVTCPDASVSISTTSTPSTPNNAVAICCCTRP